MRTEDRVGPACVDPLAIASPITVWLVGEPARVSILRSVWLKWVIVAVAVGMKMDIATINVATSGLVNSTGSRFVSIWEWPKMRRSVRSLLGVPENLFGTSRPRHSILQLRCRRVCDDLPLRGMLVAGSCRDAGAFE